MRTLGGRRIMFGHVRGSDGLIYNGSGDFRVQRFSAGTYSIAFQPRFDVMPAVVGNVVGAGVFGFFTLISISNTMRIRVETRNSAGTLADADFMFIGSVA